MDIYQRQKAQRSSCSLCLQITIYYKLLIYSKWIQRDVLVAVIHTQLVTSLGTKVTVMGLLHDLETVTGSIPGGEML